MNKQNIHITKFFVCVSPNLTFLAGREFGHYLWDSINISNNYVHLDDLNHVEFIFPDHVEVLSNIFLYGFLTKLRDMYSDYLVIENVSIIHGNNKINLVNLLR